MISEPSRPAWRGALLLLSPTFGVKGDAQAPIIIRPQDADAHPDSHSVDQPGKATLHIAYDHTSHGSQITDGMTGLAA